MVLVSLLVDQLSSLFLIFSGRPKSLVTFKGLSKFWCDQINESRTYWIRKIQIYTEDFTQYKEDWTIFETKTCLQILKELATALYVFKDLERENWKNFKTSLEMLKLELEDQWSPLHIAAKFGLELFKEIVFKFKKINPANNNGETPLHSAAKSGHLDICKFILENIQEDKNPEDNVGFTPLHYAAIMEHLDIFKFIAQNVENENPVKGSGISPYHCALFIGKKEICQFVEEKYSIIKENSKSLSLHAEIKINMSNLKAIEQNLRPLNKHRLALNQEKVKMEKRLTENCTCKC